MLVNVRNEKKQLKSVPAEWQDVDVADVMLAKDFKLGKTIELEPFQYSILKKK